MAGLGVARLAVIIPGPVPGVQVMRRRLRHPRRVSVADGPAPEPALAPAAVDLQRRGPPAADLLVPAGVVHVRALAGLEARDRRVVEGEVHVHGAGAKGLDEDGATDLVGQRGEEGA